MAAWDTAGNNIGSNAFLGSTSAEPLRIRTNNVEKMIITTDGNVGIGTPTPFTPTPGARLTVAGGDITWGNNSRLERVMNSIRNGLGMRETEIAREPS
jgi:hypothetical protein